MKRKGVSLVESGILIGLIAVASLVSLQMLGIKVSDMFNSITSRISLGSTQSILPSSQQSSGSSSPTGPGPILSWSQTSLSLNSSTENPSGLQTVTLLNSGSVATLSPFVFSGSNPSRFEVVSTNCAQSLAQNQSCNVSIRALLGAMGPYSANLSMGSANLSLNGTGSSANTSCYDWYGSFSLDMTGAPAGNPISRDSNVMLQNSCTTPINNVNPIFIYNATSTNTAPAGGSVSIINSTCPAGSSIAQWQSCQFTLRLTASRNGDYSGRLYGTRSGSNGLDYQRAVTGVVSAFSAPVFTTSSIPGTTVGQSYNTDWNVYDVNSDMLPNSNQTSLFLASGNLPPGITLKPVTGNSSNQSGGLSGTATTPGTYNFTIRAVDQSGLSSNQPFSITVADIAYNFNYWGSATSTFQASNGSPTETRNLVIQNASGSNVPVFPRILGVNAANFDITSNGCNRVVNAWDTCSVDIRFRRLGNTGNLSAIFYPLAASTSGGTNLTGISN